jgi:hypothetical protein
MATYAELSTIRDNPDWGALLNKAAVACTIKAAAIIDSGAASVSQMDWAKATLTNPTRAAENVIYYVIAKNAAATLAQIYAAGDTAIQTQVDAAVDAMFGA